MNNPNPFLSQGVFLEEKNKARNRLRIVVYSSISLSVLVLMVLLFQGCKKPAETTDNGGTGDSTANTQQLANSQSDTTASNATTLTPPVSDSNSATIAPAPAPVVNTPPPVATPPPPPVAEMQEYTIVKNDRLGTIASNNHTSVKAIMDANPGIDPKKLKVGQKIKIPAPISSQSTSVSPTAAPMAADTGASGGAITYKVKSGDNLTTIAKHYHVSIKAIQSANNLSTTSIKVGQVLKIPGAAAPAPAPESAPVPPPAPAPAPAITPAPMH
jgi:LysM repeat protein